MHADEAGIQESHDDASVTNPWCPVLTDERVDPGIHTECRGQSVAFCCRKYLKQFQANPAAYISNLSVDAPASGTSSLTHEAPSQHAGEEAEHAHGHDAEEATSTEQVHGHDLEAVHLAKLQYCPDFNVGALFTFISSGDIRGATMKDNDACRRPTWRVIVAATDASFERES